MVKHIAGEVWLDLFVYICFYMNKTIIRDSVTSGVG